MIKNKKEGKNIAEAFYTQKKVEVNKTENEEQTKQPDAIFEDSSTFEKITLYTWYQTNSRVIITLKIPGVNPKTDTIKLEEEDSRLKFKITMPTKECHFLIKHLEQPINTHTFKINSEKEEVKITLEKKYKLDWKRLKGKQRKINFDALADQENKPKDPLKNIFGMLGKLYNSGNDDMKQMIAKSWAKSEQKFKKRKK